MEAGGACSLLPSQARLGHSMTANRRRADSCQWCPVTAEETTDTNWNTGGSVWTSGNTFFTMKMTEPWHKLPRELVESLPLWSYMDMVLGNQLSQASIEQGFQPDDLQRSLPTSTIQWFRDFQQEPVPEGFVTVPVTSIVANPPHPAWDALIGWGSCSYDLGSENTHGQLCWALALLATKQP